MNRYASMLQCIGAIKNLYFFKSFLNFLDLFKFFRKFYQYIYFYEFFDELNNKLKKSEENLMSLWDKILGDPNKKEIAKLKPLVDQINKLEPAFEALTDKDLAAKTDEFRQKVQDLGKKGRKIEDVLIAILPEAFAVVREASKRILGLRHFDVQLLGGIVLHQGKIAEMKTGEGKTLAATLPVYLNALSGRGVHVVTVNDYLARRDACWMGKIYNFLGLSVGVITHEKSYLVKSQKQDEERGRGAGTRVAIEEDELVEVPRSNAYGADITYGTNNEFGFDYLRDNMALTLETCVQRELNYAIIDEVDSILIDEARTPLIISAPAEESDEFYRQFSRLVPNLKEKTDYEVDEKLRSVFLTDEGISKMERMLGIKNIYDQKSFKLVHHLEQALRAQTLFKKDRDYVVKDGEVIIVDEFTGRLMFGRRFSEGLHQALEAKEGVEIKKESVTLATITFQNYFRLYDKIAGMTGTAATESEEFFKIYKLDVVSIPTNKPMIRKDAPDRIYKTEKGKFEAVVEEIIARQNKGQPVLVGTISIEKNEILSDLLKRRGVKHEVLNAKNHEREAKIIAEAGKIGAVTIATNMAGRGVDIILGGMPPQGEASEKERRLWQKEHDQVVAAGGLHVLGTERHEARRIDNQLRGRSGRQGDPGSSQFFISLEDDLMRIFGSDRIKAMMNVLRVPENQPIENKLLSRAIEAAQQKVEGHNFDVRKHILEYDDVMNKHREAIYRKRREILEGKEVKEEILAMIREEIGGLVKSYSLMEEKFESKDVLKNYYSIVPKELSGIEEEQEEISSPDILEELLIKDAEEVYQKREKEFGETSMRYLERVIYLRIIDHLWVMHLDAMDELRTGIGLRGYGQRDPLVEYKHESYKLYQQLLKGIKSELTKIIYKVVISKEAVAGEQKMESEGQRREGERQRTENKKDDLEKPEGRKIGRNDPCPCGAIDPKTGRVYKYKKCGLIDAPYHKK